MNISLDGGNPERLVREIHPKHIHMVAVVVIVAVFLTYIISFNPQNNRVVTPISQMRKLHSESSRDHSIVKYVG